MKPRLFSGATGILIIAGLVGCSGPSRRLETTLEAYKEAYVSRDYETVASMSMPSLVEKVGGIENFAKGLEFGTAVLEKLGYLPTLIEFDEPLPIVSVNDLYVSVIPNSMPVIMYGKPGILKKTIIAFSEDKGHNWFFIEGSNLSMELLSDKAPDISAEITIPTPTIILGSGDDEEVLVQRNDGMWVKQ